MDVETGIQLYYSTLLFCCEFKEIRSSQRKLVHPMDARFLPNQFVRLITKKVNNYQCLNFEIRKTCVYVP